METKNTSIRIDRDLWQEVKRAAREWAEQNCLPPEGNTTRWVAMKLRRAVEEQDSSRPA